ncbi:hypothetical protein NKR74_23865 [Bacillus sp. 3103sda1]|uniref:hypothetical protein n=1 Tax=Bacillus sp. 3103sda1 TaxID=2953808 RepID=UPI0020A0D0C8|nr:hypothetical protein [Bacillus sp. 3103sda1]MCP1126295.1 hypothetical protein [Bacillus sp. 3103sda1]
MKKIFSKVKGLVITGGLSIALLGFFAPQAHADGFYSFATEDGAWDGYLTPTTSYVHGQVKLLSLSKVNRSNNVAERYYSPAPLSIRLCKSSYNCTLWKSFQLNDAGEYTALFYDLTPGVTYKVDIRDSWSNYYFKGKIYASRVRW